MFYLSLHSLNISQVMLGANTIRHLLSFFQVYKELDKEKTRWCCGQFTIFFKIFKGLDLVQTFELRSKHEEKVFKL